MSSIIEGYSYDIFISYRQKDNKHDGWVTEFVDNLKGELESTFKEDISIYFDENPHDGLLEIHSVDKSLDDKLRCLIFIPVISQTYCDSKSYAWQHEFCAFNKLAKADQIGRDIKLPSGNVTSRILPIKIHDLDPEDKALLENELEGVLRCIEFIYKSAGVNRPLRANEDHPHDNLNKTYYRDQINKVANAIKEIISGIKTFNSLSHDRIKGHLKYSHKSGPSRTKSFSERRLLFSTRKLMRVLPWIISGLLAVFVISAAIFWNIYRSSPGLVYRFTLNLPPSERIAGENRGSAVAISPDGEKLVFVSRRNDTTFLKLRRIDEFETIKISGTEGADAPFFSPDNNWIGFFADGNLKKVTVSGGAPQIICEARSGYEGCWGEDDKIIYSDAYKACLMRVSASGGKPEQLTTALKLSVDEGEHSHYWPQILPGGKTIIFTIWHNSEDIRTVAYSLETGQRWNLLKSGGHAIYVKTGHLVYGWKGDLLAVPFNPESKKITGQPVVIVKGVKMENSGLAHFSISNNGILAYIPGKINTSDNILAFVDFKGIPTSLNISASRSPQISPDGTQILFTRSEELSNLWVYEMERALLRRFTEKDYETFWGIWTSDGKRIVFNSNIYGGSACTLFWKKSDGTGKTTRLISGNYHQQPKCWSNSDSLLIYTEGMNPATGMDIFAARLGSDTIVKPLLNTRYNETHPDLSPNDKWLAYVSDESGREEVYVCSFPEHGNKMQISTDGGVEPLWSPDGKELYYRDVTGDNVIAVSFQDTENIRAGKPRQLFRGKFAQNSGPWGRNYDITPDGKRLLMILEAGYESASSQMNIIVNWSEELKQFFDKDKSSI
jgi:eukaryotic-like serine/threonine-protein kinase